MKNKGSNHFTKVTKKKNTNTSVKRKKTLKKKSSKNNKNLDIIKKQKGGNPSDYDTYFKDKTKYDEIKKIDTNHDTNHDYKLKFEFYTVKPSKTPDKLYTINKNVHTTTTDYNCVKINDDITIGEHRLNTETIFDNHLLLPQYSGSFYFTDATTLNLSISNDFSLDYNGCHYYIANRNHEELTINYINTGNPPIEFNTNKSMYHLVFKNNADLLQENIY